MMLWEFIKHKLAKLGCLLAIALMAIAATALTKLVLGWFHYDEMQKQSLSNAVGEHVATGLLGLAVLLGFLLMGWQLVSELRSRRTRPPPLPPPPLIERPRRRNFRTFSRYQLASPECPLPPGPPAQVAQNTKSFRGCLLATVGSVVLIPLFGIGALWWLAHLYEKGPKRPGEAEFMDVHTIQVGAYRGKEGLGNSAEAEAMAREFARSLRIGRSLFFTEGSKGLSSLTEGHFVTFCSVVSNRCAFVVHVPQLRHYTLEAKVSLGELAWVFATQQVLAKTNLHVQELAVVIQGAVNIDRILLGRIDASREPLKNLEERVGHVRDEVLYPFFDWPRGRGAEPNGAGDGSQSNRLGTHL